jgi:hypothetical protein
MFVLAAAAALLGTVAVLSSWPRRRRALLSVGIGLAVLALAAFVVA